MTAEPQSRQGRRVRLVVEIDNTVAEGPELKRWLYELATSIGQDIDGGEIVSRAYWEEVGDRGAV